MKSSIADRRVPIDRYLGKVLAEMRFDDYIIMRLVNFGIKESISSAYFISKQ